MWNGIFTVRPVPDDRVSEYGGQRMVQTPERDVRITISTSRTSQHIKSIWKKVTKFIRTTGYIHVEAQTYY